MSMSVRVQASPQQGWGAQQHFIFAEIMTKAINVTLDRPETLVWRRADESGQGKASWSLRKRRRCMRWWRWLRVVSTCLEGSPWPQRSTSDKSLHDPTSIDLRPVSVLHCLHWGRISSGTTFIIILINCRLPAPGPSFLQMWRHLLVNVTRSVAIVN